MSYILSVVFFASLTQISYSHEDPRGDVYPLVDATQEVFRVHYLMNDALFDERLRDEGIPAWKELSVLMVKELSADGVLKHTPTPGPILCTTSDTDRMYGREVGIEGIGNGFLRSDGSRWYFLPTLWTRQSQEEKFLVLVEIPWLYRDPIELPWGKTYLLRSDQADGKVLRVAQWGNDIAESGVLQLHIDPHYAIFVLSPPPVEGLAISGDGSAKARLFAFLRSDGNEFTLVHKQELGAPIIYSNVGVPCIRRNGDKYYVAYLVPTASPHTAAEFAPCPADIMLLEWAPETGQTRIACLATKIDWNTYLSFGLVGERGLLAYHQGDPQDSFLLRSRIVTRVFDLGRLDWQERERK